MSLNRSYWQERAHLEWLRKSIKGFEYVLDHHNIFNNALPPETYKQIIAVKLESYIQDFKETEEWLKNNEPKNL